MRDNTENRARKYISWEQFGILIEKLERAIKNDGRNFDSVYGIPKNGTIIASILSKMLKLKLVDSVVSTKTLIVDDISDSGKTLQAYKIKFSANIFATIHYREDTTTMPDIVVTSAEDKWICYPFEINE